MKAKYTVPDSAKVLQAVAWLLIGLGALAVVVGIVFVNQSAVVLPGAGCLLCGLIYLILAGIREAGERTAYYAQYTAHLLDKMDRERAVEKATSSTLHPAPMMAAAFNEEMKPPIARRFYFEKPGGEQQGPLEIADLQKLMKAGVIFPDTPVFREGEEVWKTLGDFTSC